MTRCCCAEETGLNFDTDAVLRQPTESSEVRLFELDNGTCPRPARQEGLGLRALCREPHLGRCQRRQRQDVRLLAALPLHPQRRFPTPPEVLAGRPEHLLDNRLEALAWDVRAITLSALKCGGPWHEIGVDDPSPRRERYSEPVSR
ncbi:hypothetical protein [Streptomyces vastus]|uniref:Uncharacterized protein n=1 Tax=Streptomyces vastus TaxID=285451 RepID=A0ABN3RWS0_9ACTN